MHSNRTILVLFIFSVLVVTDICSQCNVKGRIVDINGRPLDWVDGVILANKNILGHFVTDSTGNWQVLVLSCEDTLQIKMHHFACFDTFFNFKVTGQDTTLNTIMKCNNVLPPIEIKDRKIGMVFKGDTIQYDLGIFSDGSERTLGDILQKLPGITVNEHGQIEYKGKRVDGLLIEGKDIMNNQHKLATESLPYKDILSIQIIEKYQPFSLKVFQGMNDGVALNVQLKETSKSKLKGSLEGNAGYSLKQESKISLFNIGSSEASTNFFRSNNCGKEVISFADYMTLQTNLMRKGPNATTGGDNNIGLSFGLNPDENKSNDNLLSRNYNIELIKKELTLKYTLLAGYNSRSAESVSKKLYYNTIDTVVFENKKSSSLGYINLQLALQHTFKEKIKTEFELHGNYQKPGLNSTMSTSFIEDEFLSLLKNKTNNIDVSPELSGKISLSKKWHVSYNGSVLYKNIETKNYMADTSGIVFLDSTSLLQKISNTIKKQKLGLMVYYVSPLMDAGLNNTYKKSIENLTYRNTPTSSTLNEGVSMFSEDLYSAKGFVSFKYKKFSLTTTVEHPYLIRRSLDAFRTNQNLLNPTISLRYTYSRVSFAFINYTTGFTQPSHDLMNNMSMIGTDRSICQNNLKVDQISYSKSLSASNFYYNLGNKNQIYCSCSRTITDKPIVISATSERNYISYKAIVADQSVSINCTNNIKFKVSKLPIWLNGEYVLRVIKTLFYDRPDTEINQSNIKVGMEANPIKPVMINFSMEINSHKTKLSEFVLPEFNTYIGKIGLQYNKGKIKLDCDVLKLYNFNNGIATNKYFKVDLGSEYSLTNNIIVNLQASNLLNINGVSNNLFQNTEYYVQYTTVQLFPGFILVGVKYQL